MSKAFSLTTDSNGIANLNFNLPNDKVNKFSKEVFDELEGILDDLSHKHEIKAMTITSSKQDVFIAGADIVEFTKIKSQNDARNIADKGQGIFNKLEKLPFPTISVIDGVCLGGGLEFALACTFRIASDNPKTSIGLPEVTLGLIPGWGGTQRLPRIVGYNTALQMILQGKGF